MFERAYALRSFKWLEGEATDANITAAVAEFDRPDAAASIACMSCTDSHLNILIEYWRSDGDSQQDTPRSVDASPAVGKPRRARSSQDDDARAAAGVEPESVTLPLEPTEVVPRDGSGNAA